MIFFRRLTQKKAETLFLFLTNTFLILPLYQNLSLESTSILSFIFLIIYALGPVFFYFYVWEIGRRRLTSFIASLIYSFFTFRLSQALIFGDSSHSVALTFIPLVLLFLLRFLRHPSFNLGMITGIGIVLIALISPFGFFALLIFVGIITYSEMLLGHGRAKLLLVVIVLVLSLGISSFWYHPQFVFKLLSGEHGQAFLALIWSFFPLSFFLLPIFGAFSFLIFDRKPNLQPLFLGSSQFLAFFFLVFIGPGLGSTYVPAPSRFLPEFSLSLAFLIVLIVVRIEESLNGEWLTEKIALPPKILSSISQGFYTLILGFLFFSIIFARPFFWSFSEVEASLNWWKGIDSEGGMSQILGGGITFFSSMMIGFLKLRTRISGPNKG